MTNSEIDYIIKNRKLKLSFGQIFNHYSILILPAFFLLVTYNFSDILIWIWLAISIIIILYYRNKLNFREFKGTFLKGDIIEALNRTFREYDFVIGEINERSIIAYQYRNAISQNEKGIARTQITVIFSEGKFLINSIKNPDNPYIQLFSSNKKYLNTFNIHLKNIFNGIPEEKTILKTKREWSFKRIIIRFFTYPAFIFVIIFGFRMIFNPLNIRQPIIGIIGILIGLYYFYADISLIVREIKNRKNGTPKTQR